MAETPEVLVLLTPIRGDLELREEDPQLMGYRGKFLRRVATFPTEKAVCDHP